MCSEDDVAPFAASLFNFLEPGTSIAGMESVFLSTLNALGAQDTALFDQGTQLWLRLRQTCAVDPLFLVDKNLSCAVTVTGADVAQIVPTRGRSLDVLGNLTIPTASIAVQNPVAAKAAQVGITEGGCVGLFAAGGAILGGALTYSWAGAETFAAAGTIVGAIYCGVEYDTSHDSSSNTNQQQTGQGDQTSRLRTH